MTQWTTVALLWMVCVFNYADRQAIFSVFPLLRHDLGLDAVQLGVVGSSFMWLYALSGPMAGITGDRLSRKKVILAALIFWSLATALTSFCQTYWQLVVCRALGGFSEAFYFPAAMSMLSDYHRSQTRSRAMSIHQSGVYIGTIGGASIAGWLAQMQGWRPMFTIFGGLGILLALALSFLLQEPTRTIPSTEPRDTKSRLLNPRVLLLICGFICANFVASAFLSWMPSYLYDKFKMSLSVAGWNATAFIQSASLVGVLTGGWLADRYTGKYPAARMWTQAAGLLCGIPFLYFTGQAKQVPLLIVWMTCFGLCKGLYDSNIFASLYDAAPVGRRAVAVGLLNSFGWLGGGFAPVLLAKWSAVWGMSAVLSSTCLIYVAAAAFLLLAARSMVLVRCR